MRLSSVPVRAALAVVGAESRPVDARAWAARYCLLISDFVNDIVEGETSPRGPRQVRLLLLLVRLVLEPELPNGP